MEIIFLMHLCGLMLCVCVCTSVCTISKYYGLCIEPYILLYVCIHKWWMLPWNKVYKCTLSCVLTAHPSPDVFWITEGSTVWVFFGGMRRGHGRVRLRPTQTRRLLKQEKISDTPHCSFSHIRAPDSCMLRIFICFALWRKHLATCCLKNGTKTTGHK